MTHTAAQLASPRPTTHLNTHTHTHNQPATSDGPGLASTGLKTWLLCQSVRRRRLQNNLLLLHSAAAFCF